MPKYAGAAVMKFATGAVSVKQRELVFLCHHTYIDSKVKIMKRVILWSILKLINHIAVK